MTIFMTCVGLFLCIISWLLKHWVRWKDVCSQIILAVLIWGWFYGLIADIQRILN